jgi:glyoxylase-like metal-dependent hydrolase (beta-lactamase superfamily II)
MQSSSSAVAVPPRQAVFPFPEPPVPGSTIEVAPGILWARLPLPFQLDHINIYFVADGDGWALIDTGLGDKAIEANWRPFLDTLLRERPLTRIVATHFHPDHVGAAGYLLERFKVPLYMSASEYLQSRNLRLEPGALDAPHYRAFYLEHGLDPEATEEVVTMGHEYLRLVSALSPIYHRLIAGDELRLGRRDFEVLTGGGHSPEQIMLYERSDRLFFAADQVLAKISPNVSVTAIDPNGNPLGYYLRSLGTIKRDIADDVLVLPGHNLPFYGLHRRIEELVAHHHARCDLILDACRTEPRSAAELIPFVFRRKLDPHQTGFAFSEVLAHVNYMLRLGSLAPVTGSGEIRRVQTA